MLRQRPVLGGETVTVKDDSQKVEDLQLENLKLKILVAALTEALIEATGQTEFRLPVNKSPVPFQFSDN